jgi:hypothetical protein
MLLSKLFNCSRCGSLAHKTSDCPRVNRGIAKAAGPADGGAASAGALQAVAEEVAVEDVTRAKRAARAAVTAKAAADAETERLAANAKAAAARVVKRAAAIAERARLVQVQAVHAAAYSALVAVGTVVPATPGNYRNSRWMVVCDVCAQCHYPSGACRCL